jgi:hypothetical protein
MNKNLLLLVIIFLLPNITLAQYVEGTVIDADSEKPLQNANVFIEGTLIGTTTDKSGNFKLNVKGNFSNPIIISFVGYETETFPVKYFESNQTVRMTYKTREIDEINIHSASGSWSRNKMLRVFKEEFLGTTDNARSCKILNEDDIYLFYNENTDVLHARSMKPLIVINKMLGYRIIYLLESFQKSKAGMKFKGYNVFEEIEPNFKSLKKRINEVREKTYQVSIMHFIRYLYDYDIHKNDTIFDITMSSTKYYYVSEDIKIISEKKPMPNYDPANMDTINAKLYTEAKLDRIFNQFLLYDSLGNILTFRQIINDDENIRQICYQGKIRIVYQPKGMNSYMVLKSNNIEIAENGYYDPDLIGWYGSIGKYRLGDMLPFDYQSEVQKE